MVDVLMHAERHRRVGAVDRAGRREDEVLDAVVAAAFQHMQRPDDVGVDVGVRVLHAVAHAGLGAEMDDPLRSRLGEQPLHARPVGEIELVEGKAGGALKLASRASFSLTS